MMWDLEDFEEKWGWKLEGCDIKRAFETYVALRVFEIERRIETNPRLMKMSPLAGTSPPRGEDVLRSLGYGVEGDKGGNAPGTPTIADL
jgi:hypothetical protein